jgi:hypothetical protein
MEKKEEKNNFITHRIGLYKVAYDLSKEGNNVEIDTSASKSGHIVIHKDEKDVYVMVKALTKLAPVPFASDFEITSKFDHLIICVDVYEEGISYYSLDMQYVRNEISPNTGKDGKINYWLDPHKYKQFKVNSLVFT